jgi:hypothetical protein
MLSGPIALATSRLLACFRGYLRCSMTDRAFWDIIGKAVGSGFESEHADRLEAVLLRMKPSRIVAFAVAYESKLRAAEKGPVWAAGVLLNGGHGSDDGFLYFRHWLIGQGEAVYTAALSNPDFLADREIEFEDGVPSTEWELFGAVAEDVYRAKTGRDLHTAIDELKSETRSTESRDWHWTEYTEAFMRESLPNLWSRYGHHKAAFDARVEALLSAESGIDDPNDMEHP